jgi:acyl carrier protein
MDYVDTVRSVARSLELLKPDGSLAEMDSLKAVDLVVELEEATRISIPAHALRRETFASLESIAALLRELANGG